MASPAPERQCRFCYGNDDEGSLFSPCLCKGTQKYVHRHCLQLWRESNRAAEFRCTTCKYEYRLSRLTLATIILHPTVLFLFTLITVSCIILLASLLLNKVLILLFGIKLASRSFLGFSGKLAWWVVLAVGALTLILALFQGEDNNFMDGIMQILPELWTSAANPASFQVMGYAFSLSGFVLFAYKVYLSIRLICQRFLEYLGNQILEVADDNKDNDNDKHE
eukprot:TRINITY_DN16812_c0_g1_i2.p1 TRINITY_DN16812_c0_g1~~TRINITY_DN16812_c0_g1_i2.p1  ORF type:complete len:232 (-),score=12.06 TRINITY_DN16812_c0_g1_i2:68-733(-)